MNEKTECEFNSKLILESLACGDPYLRKNFIGASDAPIIMGVSPWRTPLQLYREKLGLDGSQKESEAMARGTYLEKQARAKFEEIMKHEYPPKRVFCSKYDWMMASLDGYNENIGDAVEIKCPGEKSHSMAKCGIIPGFYIPQLQHQMYVCCITSIYYFSYRSDDDYAILVCERDDEYIEKLINKEIEFWDCMRNMIEPEMMIWDYNIKSDIGWMLLADELKSVQKSKREIIAREEQIKKELILSCDNKNSIGHGIRVQKIVKKGSIMYDRIFKLSNVDLEQYRGKSSEYWKISTIEE